VSQVQIGQPVPDFELPSSEGGTIRLSQFRGRKVVLYFYPKDMTPTCTQESCDFRDANALFGEANAVVLGISPDDAKSHAKFIAKHQLTFPLLADVDRKVAEMFGVWQEKKMYGRTYMGIVRSTFLIDERGILAQEWRNVRVKGHIDAVLAAVRAQQPG